MEMSAMQYLGGSLLMDQNHLSIMLIVIVKLIVVMNLFLTFTHLNDIRI